MIHLIFEENISTKIQKAVNNVFENLQEFCDFHEVKVPEISVEVLTIQKENALWISPKFIELIERNRLNHTNWFKAKPVLEDNGNPDYIGTCFYMIHCLQEFGEGKTDHLGRFQFENSYQKKFNCVEENLVALYFIKIVKRLGIQGEFNRKSKIVLTHDIDLIYEAWKQDIKFLIKELRFIDATKIFINKVLGKNDWKNIEEILEFNEQSKKESTFFWLVNQGKSYLEAIKNADYSIGDKYVIDCINRIEQLSNVKNGLHKSISKETFETELNKFPTPLKPTQNRYHYLKFHPNQDFEYLSKSSIEKDYSLGFAEVIGFRNCYGLPFKPYDLKNDCTFDFVEQPLHIMDTTLFQYLKLESKDAESSILSFLEKNNIGCTIGVLWHNNFFGKLKYGAYRKVFEKIFGSERSTTQ